MSVAYPCPPLTETEVRHRLWQWAEVTALSLSLMESAIRFEFPHLSDAELRAKFNERLALHRERRLPKE